MRTHRFVRLRVQAARHATPSAKASEVSKTQMLNPATIELPETHDKNSPMTTQFLHRRNPALGNGVGHPPPKRHTENQTPPQERLNIKLKQSSFFHFPGSPRAT